jgi:hypothetical protein
VISPQRSRKHALRAAGLLAVSALAIGVPACGGSSGGSPGGSATKTVTAKQSAPANTSSSSASAPSSTSASSSNATPAASGNGASTSDAPVPDYKPSTIISKAPDSTVLTSPDSVAKIGSYYKAVLAKGGWQVRSAAVTTGSASFSAHRSGEGVTISVYPQASGSGISISTHAE